MPYVTSVERHGIEKGRVEGIREGKMEGVIEGKREGLLVGIQLQLEQKFGSAGAALVLRIREINDIEKLKSLVKAIMTASSIDELLPLLP